MFAIFLAVSYNLAYTDGQAKIFRVGSDKTSPGKVGADKFVKVQKNFLVIVNSGFTVTVQGHRVIGLKVALKRGR